ncbi:MAG: peroxiredoxin family protein [Anaerolineales bacterium]
MQQIVDLQNSPEFQSLDVALVSIALDSPEEMAAEAAVLGITDIPLLSDPNGNVSASYDVLQWAVASGEPSHTFVLVDQSGQIVWVKDYGAPDKPDRTMYVPVQELIKEIKDNL